jgi:pyruvate,water dikinase
MFNFITNYVYRIAPVKETVKSLIVRKLALTRKILLELGNRITSKKILESPKDIFFLQLPELNELLSGKNDGELIRNLIIQRQTEYAKNLLIEPPPIVYGHFDPTSIEETKVDENIKMLQGVPVHPGIVEGPARVILRTGEDTVQPGEILVAPFTDPGWTPYFLNAAGIVMDLGGVLSHGSIIAREYGIPAVVNVGPATKIIKTGQIIRVDGNLGIVTIISERHF